MAAFHSHSSAADLLAAAAAAAKMDAANAGNPASTSSTAAASGTATPTASASAAAAAAAATASARKGVRGNKRARLVCMRCHEKKIKCDLQHSTIGPDNEHPKCTRCDLAGYECRVRLSKRGSGNQAASRRASAAAATTPTTSTSTTATTATTTSTTNTAITSRSATTTSASRSPTTITIENPSNQSPVESYSTTNGNGNNNSVLPVLPLGSYDRMGHHHRQQHAHLSHTTASASNSRKPSLLNPANGRDAHTKRNGSMLIIAAAAAAAAGNDGFDEPVRSDSDEERRSPTSRSNGSDDSNNSRCSPTNTSAPALTGSSLAAPPPLPPPPPHPQTVRGNGAVTQLPPPSSMTGRDSVISTYNSGAGSFSGGLPSFPPHQTAAAAAAHRRFSEAVTYGYGHGHGHSHVYGYPNGDGYGHTHVNGHGNNHAVHGGYSALNNGNGNGHGNDKGTGSGSGQGYMGTGTGSRVISSESTASAPSLPSTITTGAANGIAEQRQQPAPVLPADHPVYRPDSVSGLAGAHPNPSSSAPAYGQHHQHPAAIHPPTGYGHGSYASGGYTQHLKKEYDEYERDDGHGPMNSHAHVQSAQGYPSSATGYYRDKEKGNNSRKREREWEDDCDRDRARDSTDPVGLLNVLNHHLPVAPHHHPHHSHGLLSAQLYHHSAYDHDRTLPPLHSSSCNPAHHPSAHHHPDHHFHIHTPASSQCQSTCASRANSAAVPLPNASIATSAAFDLPPTILQESFIETYFEYAYTWCPVLDRAMLLIEPHILESPLLKQALALLGSRIEPPVMQHASPNQYYERATQLFHNNIEKDPIVSLQALMMLYWWGAAPAPGTVSFDTVWWWTGIAIRLAQQVGLHRELPPSAQTPRSCPPGLRRRIWWTLYARERLTSMCEGRPCIIDPADCDVKEPSVHDFPETVDLLKAQTFVSWVKLSRIVGRVAKYRSSKTEDTRFPGHIARELIDWVKSLPDSLWLPIGGDRSCTSTNPSSATTPGCNAVAGKGAGALSFHRDVHQLYLPYLSAITLLYLTKSSQPLAKAYQTAILSAACVARIFEDFLARRSVRFLQGLSGWHIAIAILALLHGRKIKQLTEECDRNIALLRIALKEVGKSWSSARLFDAGFERVIRSEMFASTVAPMTPPLQQQPQQHPVLSTLVAPQQSIPPPHVAAQVSPTSVTPTVAADSSEVDIDQLDKQTKDDENKDKQEDERRSSDTDAKSVSSFAEKCASPKESSDSLPNPSASPKDDVSSVISDSKVQSTAASTPAITTTASATTTMTVPTTTSTAIHTPVTSNQITLPPMALHPHLRPARPGCNSSLSELADVATGTLINWLDFFPFATRETSPLVDVLLQTSRAGLLEFDAVDWPVGDMSRMLNDLLYY